jgi:hypothetical protein
VPSPSPAGRSDNIRVRFAGAQRGATSTTAMRRDDDIQVGVAGVHVDVVSKPATHAEDESVGAANGQFITVFIGRDHTRPVHWRVLTRGAAHTRKEIASRALLSRAASSHT